MRVAITTAVRCAMLVACFEITAAFIAPAYSSAESTTVAPTDKQVLKHGQQMYREGKLPSGKPMQSITADDTPIIGTVYSCAGCHQRSGLGSYDEIRYPAVIAAKLFQPLYAGPEYTPAERAGLNKYLQQPMLRDSYTDASLAEAIRNGRNPDGRMLNKVMPRYLLEDGDMKTLISYLKTLSTEISPGVTATTIRFATVIAGDVPSAERKEMLGLLDNLVAFRNRQAEETAVRRKYASSVDELDLYTRKISISRWELKGPAETWRRQLEEHYRKEPVFALVGGIAQGAWKPVHDFCEDNRIPALFPVTELPVVSQDDWYTMYFSKGLHQEGEAAAGYLAETAAEQPEKNVLMIVDDTPRSMALAEGFDATWRELDRKPARKVIYGSGDAVDDGAIQALLAEEKPAYVLLWSSRGTFRILETLNGMADAPEMIFMSTTLLGKTFKSVPEKMRTSAYFTYPFKFSSLDKQDDPDYMALRSWLHKQNITVGDQRIATRLFPLFNILSDGLMHMKRNFYRDHFLEVISMRASKKVVDYDRLVFAQDDRYASKNCYIVQLSPGPMPTMIKKKEWIIY